MTFSSAPPMALLDIDLSALLENLKVIRRGLAPLTEMAAVLKADAYGIGMAEVAEIHRCFGTKTYFVATPEEGEKLRLLLGPDVEIGILSGLIPGESGFYRDRKLTPVLNNLHQLGEWKKAGGGYAAMLHFDTGMSRLGLDRVETRRLLADLSLLDGVRLSALLSHFACADEGEHPLTLQQKDDFERITGHILHKYPGIRRSLSNSAGIFASSAYHYDLVRPGMAVYGLNPTPDKPNPMKNIVTLRARILQIRDALPGESIGYGASYRCQTPQSVATVGLGYADGFLRRLSNRATLFWNGQPCPVLGRVSMDMVSVDLTGLAGEKPREGDFLEVLGANQDADALAKQAGTIGYEILTGLGARYRRRYHHGDAV